MARLLVLVAACITLRHHAFLRHHRFLLSLAGSTLPRVQHHPPLLTSAPRLPLSRPRRKRLRRSRLYSQRWSHRHYFSSSVALSGKLSQGKKQPPMRRRGTQTRSGASSKVRQLSRSSTLSQMSKWALQPPYLSRPSLTVWRCGSVRKIPVSLPYWRTAYAH